MWRCALCIGHWLRVGLGLAPSPTVTEDKIPIRPSCCARIPSTARDRASEESEHSRHSFSSKQMMSSSEDLTQAKACRVFVDLA